MLKSIYNIFWQLKRKPPLLMEDSFYTGLEDNVQLKMFAQKNLGRALLFTLYKELGNEELRIGTNGFYESRYNLGAGASDWCWSIDLIYFALDRAKNQYNSSLQYRDMVSPRELFYTCFGDGMGAEFTETPAVGHIVLLPNASESSPKIGVVSRIIQDRQAKVKKWWHIVGNEGLCMHKVKEVRGDLKKTEGFMDVSKVRW